MADAPKKRGALAALVIAKPSGDEPYDGGGPAKPHDEPDEDDQNYGGDDYEVAAFESLADALSILPPKREQAAQALKQYIRACVREYDPTKGG